MVREAAITVATLLFAATLFMLLGRLGAIIVERLASLFADVSWLDRPWLIAFVVIILLVLLSVYCGRRININRFSLHGVYRNRLARAFIGTARPPAERNPDAYTRFDPADNVRMQELYQGKEQRGILFPVVNVTLNLLEGAPSGWAERKAAPFTITPLRAGAACLGEKDVQGDAAGRYVRTEDYAGQEHESGLEDVKSGITLGTAITISGAAVSPNMGYHSSPATAFLMTLFNVRLGAWLPNPGVGQRWTPAKPSNALLPLFNEMLGRANDQRSDVFLSDGGHFDNLGIYEMLRRQCRRIVAIDAGCDPEYNYGDLGRALRMASIDLHVTVDFIAPVIKGDESLNASGALAGITYDDGSKGRLLYLKPGGRTTCRPVCSLPGGARRFSAPEHGRPVLRGESVRELSRVGRADHHACVRRCGELRRRRAAVPGVRSGRIGCSQGSANAARLERPAAPSGINRRPARFLHRQAADDRARQATDGRHLRVYRAAACGACGRRPRGVRASARHDEGNGPLLVSRHRPRGERTRGVRTGYRGRRGHAGKAGRDDRHAVPPGSDVPDSNMKPAILAVPDRVAELAASVQAAMPDFVAEVRSGDRARIAAVAATMNKACDACHNEFRKEE